MIFDNLKIIFVHDLKIKFVIAKISVECHIYIIIYVPED